MMMIMTLMNLFLFKSFFSSPDKLMLQLQVLGIFHLFTIFPSFLFLPPHPRAKNLDQRKSESHFRATSDTDKACHISMGRKWDNIVRWKPIKRSMLDRIVSEWCLDPEKSRRKCWWWHHGSDVSEWCSDKSGCVKKVLVVSSWIGTLPDPASCPTRLLLVRVLVHPILSNLYFIQTSAISNFGKPLSTKSDVFLTAFKRWRVTPIFKNIRKFCIIIKSLSSKSNLYKRPFNGEKCFTLRVKLFKFSPNCKLQILRQQCCLKFGIF